MKACDNLYKFYFNINLYGQLVFFSSFLFSFQVINSYLYLAQYNEEILVSPHKSADTY